MDKNDSIRLHPEHGVNPTMVQYFCPVTGKVWDSGELALLGWNRGKEADRYTVMGKQVCPEVKEKLDGGYVALIGVDLSKTDDKENPFRTGDLIYVKKEVAKDMLGMEVDVAYADVDLVKVLKQKVGGAANDNASEAEGQ